MALFLTGSTGSIGSYVAADLLKNHSDRLALLVRAKDEDEARKRLWKVFQLHMGFEEFSQLTHDRVDLYLGDLSRESLGLDDSAKHRLVKTMDSVIHCAASLNRKSAKACFNVNLRGTLHVLKLAQAARDDHGLRRFSDVSTVAVCGKRKNETLTENDMLEWSRSDYDPYARTKKFCEYMVEELLSDVERTVFRPSIVLGDSRFPETIQFDMLRAFVMLASVPVLPFRKSWRVDIAPTDFVAKAIVHIHQKRKPDHDIYNLTSGIASLTYEQIVKGLGEHGLATPHVFIPWLEKPVSHFVNALSYSPKKLGVAYPASLMKVFMPYLTFNTVFDNSRITQELGEHPVPFTEYAYELFRFAKACKYNFPYQPWPEVNSKQESQVA